MKTRKEMAIYYAECKEQATPREWSSFCDKRVEAYEAGFAEGIQRVVDWLKTPCPTSSKMDNAAYSIVGDNVANRFFKDLIP